MGQLLAPNDLNLPAPVIEPFPVQHTIADGCKIEKFRELIRLTFWLTREGEHVVVAKIVVPISTCHDIVATLLPLVPTGGG